MSEKIKLNGIEYVRADSVPTIETSGRYIVVVDRGWVYAGDLSETEDRYVRLTNTVNVRKWHECGFSGVVEGLTGKMTLEAIAGAVEINPDTILFRVPVGAEWPSK